MRSADETRQFVESYIRAFNARDLDAVAAIYAEHATLEDPVGSQLHEGRAAIRAFYEQYRDQPSFLQLTGDFYYAGDAVAFSFFCFLGTGPESMIVQITDTFRFDTEGRVSEMRAFWGAANIGGARSGRDGDGGLLPLAGRAVLVVGDGPVALACARSLGRKGAVIVAAGVAAQADRTVRSVREAGGRAHALPTGSDMGTDLPTATERAIDLVGQLDCCVNAFELAREDLGTATAKCAREQARALLSPAGIINVIVSGWDDALPEALRSGTSHAVRINCVLRGTAASPDAIADAVTFLASPAASALDRQILLVRACA